MAELCRDANSQKVSRLLVLGLKGAVQKEEGYQQNEDRQRPAHSSSKSPVVFLPHLSPENRPRFLGHSRGLGPSAREHTTNGGLGLRRFPTPIG